MELIKFQNDELERLHRMGRGGMGEVWLYKFRPPKHGYVAVKTLIQSHMLDWEQERLKKEMSILKELNHRNVVKAYGFLENETVGFGLVLEFCSFGNYIQFFREFWDLQNVQKDTLQYEIAPLKIRLLGEIADAMAYLHGFRKKKVLHLDLKGENVLLDDNLHAKICDFGLSRLSSTLSSLCSSQTVPKDYVAGTPAFIAPERLRDLRLKPTTKCDVYSFGILTYTILTDEIPFPGITRLDILEHHVVTKNQRPGIEAIPRDLYPVNMIDMMKACWVASPNDRPSFNTLQHDINDIQGSIEDFDFKAKSAVNKVVDLMNQQSDDNESEPEQQGDDDEFEPILSEPPIYSVNEVLRRREVCSSNTNILWKIMGTLGLLCVIAIVVTFLVLSPNNGTSPVECPSLKPIDHGSMKCTNATKKTSKKCIFTCDVGYGKIGVDSSTCVAGKWTDNPPTCVKKCRNLPKVANGEITCSSGFMPNSTCNFTCLNHHVMNGNATIQCLINSSWSSPEPTCDCLKCTVGDKCQYPLSWKSVRDALDGMKLESSRTMNYGEKILSCSNSGRFHNLELKYTGICIEGERKTECSSGYKSPSGAAEHAAADLIRQYMSSGSYYPPCDAQNLPTGC